MDCVSEVRSDSAPNPNPNPDPTPNPNPDPTPTLTPTPSPTPTLTLTLALTLSKARSACSCAPGAHGAEGAPCGLSLAVRRRETLRGICCGAARRLDYVCEFYATRYSDCSLSDHLSLALCTVWLFALWPFRLSVSSPSAPGPTQPQS